MNNFEADYDRNNPTAIYDFCQYLIGKSLYDIFGKEIASATRKGKGGLGQMVEELFFNYEVNSDRHADFKEAGVELKCTPLLQTASGYRIKERLVCTMIDYFAIVSTDFADSHLIHKCRLMLLLFYLHVSGQPSYSYKFLFRVLWSIPEKDLIIIRNDYETIAGKVRRGEAHLLSEGDTMYLGACRKGQKGDKLQRQPFSDEGAKKRAFSLKPAYMRHILQHVLDSGASHFCNYSIPEQPMLELVKKEELAQHPFEQIIKDRFLPYFGKNYTEICEMLGMPPYQSKSKYADVAALIASENTSKRLSHAEEFIKSGIILKTVRIDQRGMPEESMSFKNIDYDEVYNNDDWIESEAYELFTSRFLFAVFQKAGDETISIINSKTGEWAEEPAYVLTKVFFWTMPQADLTIAEQYWESIRLNVMQNNISLDHFWSISDHRRFHVRPKGTKSSYINAAHNPNGGVADKFCYWFNADYVKNIIETN